MLIALLHGFWGQGKDGQRLFEALKVKRPLRSSPLRFWAPDLFSQESRWGPEHGFSQWSRLYVEELLTAADGDEIVLVGYSLGGRLALHCLKELAQGEARKPLLTVFLSSNPGLIEKNAVAARREWEAAWQRRFKDDDWDTLERDWNALGVFKASGVSSRAEKDFSRTRLSAALTSWSVTRHQATLSDIKGQAQLWCFGQEDAKYRVIGAQVQEITKAPLRFVEGAGHRLLIDASGELAEIIAQAL